MALPSTGRSGLPGCALYFFLFMSLGSLTPFVPVIWRSKGLSEAEVGLLGAVRPISILLAGPVICALTDKYGVQQMVLYGLMLLFAIARSTMLVAGGFWALAAVEISCSVSMSTIMSIIDAAVRNVFGSDGYGTQRSWGAAGYGLAALMSGFVYDVTGGSYDGVVAVYVTVLALALVAALGVPVGRTDIPAGGLDDEEPRRSDRLGTCDNTSSHGETELVENDRESDDEAAKTLADIRMNAEGYGKGDLIQPQDHLEQEERGVASVLWIMFSTPQHFSFFLGVILSGMAKGVIDTFLFIWLDELGGSHVLLGLAGLVMCCAEVPFFYVSGFLIRKIGPRNVVALSQIGYIVRLVYYSGLWDPWWVLPAELLHGLTFAATWAATTDYAHGIAPAHLRTTMQATKAGLNRGMGYGLGAILGGVAYSNLGPRRCFLASAALPLVSLLFLIVLPWVNVGGDLRKQGTGEEGLEHWGPKVCHKEVSADENGISGEFGTNNLDAVESRPE
ncbi:unnamed protein product [Ectocarpus fasciculatus]